MRRYDARDPKSIRLLADDLLGLPAAARPAVVARLMTERIMIPSQWWVRFSVWLAKKRHGLDTFDAWALLLTRLPSVADESIEQTAQWIVSGKDASGEGIGGLDQKEVDTVGLLIHAIRGLKL